MPASSTKTVLKTAILIYCPSLNSRTSAVWRLITAPRLMFTKCPLRTTCRPSTNTSRAVVGPASKSAAGSQLPAATMPDTSHIAISARHPGDILPQSGRPSIFAPPRVAISSASRALIALAPDATRCKSIACRASATRLPASLLADPSTPSPTGTPASRIARTGAIPDPSLQFEQGQWATPVPVSAKSAISDASSLTQCACQTSCPVQPRSCAYCPGRQPNFSRE
mmetsp:Transcript_23745/g.42566  ORF Transcript_23745/g.42566 Transcript_23745/m.42566 type:complete len:225 (+) Transcript_23745:1745-2419(+)